jgi:hypothetical protein
MRKPSEFLTSVYRSNEVSTPLRIAAATAAAPYVETRPVRKITTPITLPPSNSVEQARANINLIRANLCAGVISFEDAEALIRIEQVLIEANVGVEIEQGMRALETLAHDAPPVLAPAVQGGLPRLPLQDGQPEIIMPTPAPGPKKWGNK